MWNIRDLTNLWGTPEVQAASHRVLTFLKTRKERKGKVDTSWLLELLWSLETVTRGRRLRQGLVQPEEG